MSTSEPLSRTAHNWGQAPLSPPSPTSSTIATTTSAIPKRTPLHPNLPSSPAPSHSSADASPNIESLSICGPTPPASVPMSAQQSQSSITDASLYSPPADQTSQLDSVKLKQQPSSFESQLRSVSGSKRRIEDDAERETPSKRARTNDATDDKASASPSFEQPSWSLGPLFKLDSQLPPLSQPHASQNLLSLYGLEDVASSVTRKDASGAKINKLRKSYENYLKDIPGRDKKREQNFELRNIVSYPEEEYHIQQVSGRELSRGMTDSMLAKLEKATKMGPGRLPDAEDKRWKSIIDTDGQKAPPQPLNNNIKRGSEVALQYSATSPTTNESARQSRRGVKRRYNDESFEGYAESFAEDGHEANSVDNGDEGDGGLHGKRKQRRRDTASSPKYPEFGPNGLNNAVSVGGYGGR